LQEFGLRDNEHTGLQHTTTSLFYSQRLPPKYINGAYTIVTTHQLENENDIKIKPWTSTRM
jgi:hypothetical protein